MTAKLLKAVDEHSRLRPNGAAARELADHRILTWLEMQAQIEAIARALQNNIPTGATVILCYPNRPAFIAAFLGIIAGENSPFPISFDSAAPELQSAAERSCPAAAIVAGSMINALKPFFQSVEPFGQVADDAALLTRPLWTPKHSAGPALLLQSSGTTSRPKIVRREAISLDAVASAAAKACGFISADQVLAAVPLSHSYGLEHGLLAPMLAGSSVEVCPRFDLPQVLGALRSGGITLMPGVPFMFDLLTHAEGPFPTLRKAYSAGGPLLPATSQVFAAKFGLSLGQVYGATEIGSVTFNDPTGPNFVPQSVGRPMEGVSLRIVDAHEPRVDRPLPVGIEGQVAVAAASMFSGYLDDPSDCVVDGYYLTGDLGRLDADGSLTITGRLKLLIEIGGRKVNPAEVEDVLRQFPGVGACVVIPMRLSETVSRLKAIVTPAEPQIELSPGALRAFVRQRLSAYKVPRVFEVRKSLPTSASGKVLRRLVETS